MPSKEFVTIDTCQLQIGMYVYIDLKWMDHPFPLNRFKIKSEDQIATIGELGIKKIRYYPAKSDTSPLLITSSKTEIRMPEPIAPSVSPEIQAELLEKKEHKLRLEQHREKIVECKKTIANAAKLMRRINDNIFSKPQSCIDSANQMLDGFLDTLMENETTVLFVLNDAHSVEVTYTHSVNVSVLAMLLAKELKFPPEVIRHVGMGSLFHDIGKLEIPSKITLKTDPLTAAEESLLKEHTVYGEKIVRNAKLDASTLAVVAQHHEYIDGTGYPRKLKEDEINPLAQLVAIINLYDNLCNPINPSDALTPHEALSKLFAQYRNKLNTNMLQIFIRYMGIYPPGSIVGLSNGTIGIVVSISSGKTLNPTLMIYDSEIPKEEAILLDLETMPEVNISKAIRPMLLAPEVFSYLSPNRRTTYYFDTTKS